MRGHPVLIILALLMASCQVAVDPIQSAEVPPAAEARTLYVVDSAWALVRLETVQESRELTLADIEADVIAYNATHTDDQQTILDKPPVLEEAPTCNAWIVERLTHAVLEEYLGWDRSDLTTRREQWRTQTASHGDAVLYVDHLPPAPEIVIDTRPAYEKYALYLVAADGSILAEEHLETYEQFAYRLPIYDLQSRADGNGEYVVSGRLYVPVIL